MYIDTRTMCRVRRPGGVMGSADSAEDSGRCTRKSLEIEYEDDDEGDDDTGWGTARYLFIRT